MKGAYTAITWILRILTGAVFIFSGFVKAIDPWGTLYKFEDYMAAMHLPVFRNILLVAVFALCAYEFTVGIFLLLGCFRRSAPILAAIMMAVMLPLTLWIAIADPVADCGCFGDALIISNWATFWKNVVIVAAIVWLIKFNTSQRCLIRPSLQWIVLIASTTYTAAIGFAGYVYQPLIDFRPYRIGTPLLDHQDNQADSTQSAEENMLFVYQKDGIEKRFSIDDELPDEADGWTFVRRESVDSENKNDSDNTAELSDKDFENSEVKNFRIWDESGVEDITDDVFGSTGRQLILLMPDLKSVSMATTWQINSLYTWSGDNDTHMIGIVAGTPTDIAEWKDLSLAAYPIYTADDTEIKMVARGNPAVVYLDKGIIKWKSTLRALNTEDFQSDNSFKDPEAFSRDNHELLLKATAPFVSIIAVLILLSLFPLGCLFLRKPKKVSEKESDSENLSHDDRGVR